MVASLVLVIAATTGFCQEADAQQTIRAFPDAEGFGADTIGGRGGQVLIVTSLDDYKHDDEPIPGTLRWAVETKGPRTVVFEVAGYVELERPLDIREPYLTIAAQSAPGEGVALKNYSVEIFAPQVILRYLRVRPGDVAGIEQDAINIHAPDVIVDHCSTSWGTDEVLSVIGRADRVSIQRCLISESLNNSVHSKGMHGYGTLLTNTGDVSIHHNVYAFHYSRNPRPKDLTLDFRNNVVYGWGDQAGYNYEDHTRMNYVGNVIHPLDFSKNPVCAFNLGGLNSSFFVSDNLLLDGSSTTGDWEFICYTDGVTAADAAANVKRAEPVEVASVTTQHPTELWSTILIDVGATRPARDAVDTRVLALIEDGTGVIIDSQSEVGGWVPLMSAEPPLDVDRDGMPDAWETSHGLNPDDSNDHASDADGDGYTNLEEFLNETDPQRE